MTTLELELQEEPEALQRLLSLLTRHNVGFDDLSSQRYGKRRRVSIQSSDPRLQRVVAPLRQAHFVHDLTERGGSGW